MSWIKKSTPEHSLEKIFAQITKAGAALRAQAVELMPLMPDVSASSYFVKRSETRLSKAAMELKMQDAAKLPRLVASYSQEPVRAVVHDLTEQLVGLAPHYELMQQSEDVSPYIYVMF